MNALHLLVYLSTGQGLKLLRQDAEAKWDIDEAHLSSFALAGYGTPLLNKKLTNKDTDGPNAAGSGTTDSNTVRINGGSLKNSVQSGLHLRNFFLAKFTDFKLIPANRKPQPTESTSMCPVCAKICLFACPTCTPVIGGSGKCHAFSCSPFSVSTSNNICHFYRIAYTGNNLAANGQTAGGDLTDDDASVQPSLLYIPTALQTWAKNDPEVANMRGESFDIMQTGTFLMLFIPNSESSEPSLKIDATIDRAGSRCGATYITNVTLKGTWVEELGSPYIAMRAKPAVPKLQALEIDTEGTWKRSSYSKKSIKSNFLLSSTATTFQVQLNKVKIFVSIDAHRIVEHGKKGSRFANYLNLNVKGLTDLSMTNIGGLLGTDDHEYAMQLPEQCDLEFTQVSKDRSMYMISDLTAKEE